MLPSNGATEEDWFSCDAPNTGSIAAYVAAPPKGMSNPPQNPKVRKALAAELNDLAVRLEYRDWPPPRRIPSIPVSSGMERHRQQLLMRKSPSSPAVFGGTSLNTSVDPFSAKKLKSTKRNVCPASQSGERAASAKWVYSIGLDEHSKEFDITLERQHGGTKLGICSYGSVLLANPESGSLVEQWNWEHQDLSVQEGDCIVEVNGIRGDLRKMTKQLKRARVCKLKIRKAWTNSADVNSQSRGSPTALWRTRRDFMLEDEELTITGGNRPPLAAPKVKKIKGDDAWVGLAKQKILDRVPTDLEMKNSRDVLKAQSNLNAAEFTDRFRMNADMSPSAPLFLDGAGTPSCQPNDSWSSDGAILVMFHNGALRLANPSKLQMAEELEVTAGASNSRRKRDSTTNLLVTSSSQFRPKYPIDHSLRSLRKFRKHLFPQQVLTQEEERRQAAQAIFAAPPSPPPPPKSQSFKATDHQFGDVGSILRRTA